MLIDEDRLITTFMGIESDVCADYGDYAECGYSLLRVREIMDIAKSAGLPKQECYMVLHRNYAEGSDVRAYWSVDAARKAVEDEQAFFKTRSLCFAQSKGFWVWHQQAFLKFSRGKNFQKSQTCTGLHCLPVLCEPTF